MDTNSTKKMRDIPINLHISGLPSVGATHHDTVTEAYTYDTAGRLDGEYDPMGYARTYTYDAAGNVASMTDELNRTTHYQYDELNRLIQATYPDNTTKGFTYTSRGKLAYAGNANLGYGFAYDAADRLIAVDRSDGRNIGYQYDAANRRTHMTTPDGRTFVYGYDTAGRLSQITQSANTFAFSYDTAGRRTGLSHPNGVSTEYGYSPSGYLTSILARYNQTTTDSYAYTHDGVGNRTTTADLFGVHQYDYAYQLLSAVHPDALTENFTYDEAGNRLSATVDEENTPAGTAIAYGYDYENKLIQVTLPNTTVQYKYDPFGRRIEKSVNNVITRYLYDGPNVVTEYDDNGNTTAKYTHNLAVDDPLAVQQGTSTYYYHKDGLGSVTALTNPSGSVVKRYRYRAFGEIYSEPGSVVQPYTFTAREKDPETGLYYYRARYYDPKAGRFISKDPIGFAGGDANLFKYAQNNPINRIDPSGLDWIYSQSTGQLYYQPPASAGGGPPQPIATGYSGNGAGLNNPAMQDVPNVGPIPQGTWIIGPQEDNRTGSGHSLPASMRLTPQDVDTDRSGFLIHGDNSRGNQSASEGCVILNRNVRNRIGNSGDDLLRVIP
jgi:RHS repeat-associated protein